MFYLAPYRAIFELFWDQNGTTLDHFGVIQDHFWLNPGSFWGHFGSFWHRFGIVSVSFWCRFFFFFCDVLFATFCCLYRMCLLFSRIDVTKTYSFLWGNCDGVFQCFLQKKKKETCLANTPLERFFLALHSFNPGGAVKNSRFFATMLTFHPLS